MPEIKRRIENEIRSHLKRGKSILLLGPRQTGKTTLLEKFPSDLSLNFVSPKIRQRYERNPDLHAKEIALLPKRLNHCPLILLDEVQKVPEVLSAYRG